MLIAPMFAHEVYVLPTQEIIKDKSLNSPNVFDALNNAHNLWLFISILALSAIVFAVLLYLKSTKIFKRLGKYIDKATVIAPDIIRITFGLSLINSVRNNAVFGPELPLAGFAHSSVLRILLVTIGLALTLGIFLRLFSWLALTLCIYLFAVRGWYMLTYLNYLGEAIAVVLLPVQALSLDRVITKLRHVKVAKMRYSEYSMPATRIFFGAALLYAAINVKFVTSALSVDVVNHYKLTSYFPFDPLFVVLGSGLVEIMIALLYMFGLLQRVNTVIFLTFITLSLIFFKEAVWPHYLLIALGVGIFLHKPDKWALDRYLFTGKISKKQQS